MEFKLFGRGGYPSNRFQKGLKVLFALDDREWDVIAKWLLETDSFDSHDAVSSPSIVASSLTPDQFIESVEVLQFIFEAWSIHGLDIKAALELFLPVLRADFELVDAYKFKPGVRLSCPIAACAGSSDREISADALDQWKIMTNGPFCLKLFQGSHFYLHSQWRSLVEWMTSLSREWRCNGSW
jgi:hypothetical protein